jgi:tetratricopeptide (TPR) repeat protein
VLRVFLAVAVLTATESFAATSPREPAFAADELLAGTTLPFSADTSITIPSRDDAFGLDSEMRAFVAATVDMRDSRKKLVALLKGMEDRGLFSLDYDETTRTARSTFHDRQGNCLSFTMLFVGLARAAGLTATYQSVSVPPTWANDGKVVIGNHVNTRVRTAFGEETVVDFNIRQYELEQRSRRVDDDYALALFYTNLGAEGLLRGEYPVSLVYFRAAAEAHREMAQLWVNLGVLYAHHGLLEQAEAAYLHALEVDEREQSALANLAVVYADLGELDLAADYRERVQNYRDRNPYYHFAVATLAYDEGRLPDALDALRKALRLKHDEADFHSLRGRVLEAMGRVNDATQSFVRAHEYAEAEKARASQRIVFDALAVQ